jgi:hypothetical protein
MRFVRQQLQKNFELAYYSLILSYILFYGFFLTRILTFNKNILYLYMLKIWEVNFNDGGWHQSLPSFTIIAESSDMAKKIAIEQNERYSKWIVWATELKIPGYIIEVYDEKTYNREKNLDKLL